ncbi:MAG: hypothetical protein HQ534_06375 [Armatimonadetes bacterium]|nr:hypothetical protein [Armatimonadota bacterium]
MKKILITALIMLITSFVYCWQSVGFKINDHDLIKDYQLPAWGYSIFDIDFSGNSYYRRSDTDYKRVNESYGMKLSPGYHRNFESEKIKYTLNSYISSDFTYSGYKNEEQETDNISRDYRYTTRVEGDFDYYFKKDLFLNTSVDSRFIYQERNDSQNNQDFIDRQIFTSSFIGIGWGKIRDVSPVFRALRLRERVEALNKGLTLSENQLEILSDKFALYTQYVNVYDRYEKYFWKEISPILGSEFDALNLFENLYLTEVMKEYIRRYQGHEILLGIDFWQDYEIENDGDKTKEFHLGPSLSYNYYNNINLKYQIRIYSKISYLKYLSDESSEDSKFMIDFTNSHHFDITDRLRWNSSISLNYDYTWYENFSGSVISTTLSSYIDYFIENNLALSCQLTSKLIHVGSDIYENNANDYGYSDLKRYEYVSYYFGCRYYFGSIF